MRKVKIVFVVILFMLAGISDVYSQEINDDKININPSLFSIKSGIDFCYRIPFAIISGKKCSDVFFGDGFFLDVDITLSYYFKVIGIDITFNAISYVFNFDIGLLFSIPFRKWLLRINPIGGFTTDFDGVGFNIYANIIFDFPIMDNLFLGIHTKLGGLYLYWEDDSKPDEYAEISKFTILSISIIFSVGF